MVVLRRPVWLRSSPNLVYSIDVKQADKSCPTRWTCAFALVEEQQSGMHCICMEIEVQCAVAAKSHFPCLM